MITNKKELLSYIKADKIANHMEHYYFLKLIYGNDGARAFKYLKSLRHLEYCINTGNLLLMHWYRYKTRRLGKKYNVHIVPNTVGRGLYLPHLQGGGVIINCKKMGSKCIVGPGVIVGNKGLEENIATIGNHVELTMGCKVVGKVTIGDYAIVAPNSVVIKDVPAKAVVSGVPAKIIKINE